MRSDFFLDNRCLFLHNPQDSVILFSKKDYWLNCEGIYAWHKCNICGAIFINPVPHPDTLSDYYPSNYALYNSSLLSSKSPIQLNNILINESKRFSLIQKHLKSFNNKSIELLDLGCSTGNFIFFAKRNGWICTGLELDKEASYIAREVTKSQIIQGEIAGNLKTITNTFDVITMWDVLEHMYSPLEIIQDCYSITKPNGLVIFSIPYTKSLDAKIFGKFWIGFDTPRHFHLLSLTNIKNLVDNVGFRSFHLYNFGGSYWTWLASIDTWIGTLRYKFLVLLISSIFHSKIIRALLKIIYYWVSKLGWGSVITVIAEK